MPYLMIDDFARGIDLRKSAVTAPAGSLRTLTNAVVTAGGEIEKRKMLSYYGNLPPDDTYGLSFDGTNAVVFGTKGPEELAFGPPPFVVYQQLDVSADPAAITKIKDAQVFASKQYVVAEFDDGSTRHFYDGAPVADTGAEGDTVYAHKAKLYSTDGPNLRFCAVADATDWGGGAGAGAGIIDVTTMDAASADLVGVEQYYSNLALFGRTAVQIWAMDPDPNLNRQIQVLGNAGLLAPHGLARYGNGDVLFLSNNGVRSLRARNSSNAAALNDVGAPIDNLIRPLRDVLTPDVVDRIRAVVDPLTGRFWLTWDQKVLVLSTFLNSDVSAWSVFDFPYRLDHIMQANSRIAVRSGDDLFLYGSSPPAGTNPFNPDGLTGGDVNNYDATEVVVETPFMDGGDPAAHKHWTALDVSATGTWDVYINPSTDPANGWMKVATITEPTWNLGSIPLDVQSSHIAVRFVSRGAEAAALSSMGLHFDGGEKR